MPSHSIDVRLVTGRIGAEVLGLDLSTELSDTTVATLRALLVQHKVLFFRQQRLDARGQVAFARRFGPVTHAHPTVPALAEHPEVLDLDYSRSSARANRWHTDVTFVDQPPLGSVLRAITIPAAGGDTLWANQAAAYQDLPAPLRALADTLWAVHSNAYDYVEAAVEVPEDQKERRRVFQSTVYETLHPVVRVHPESGERSLFIGGFVRQLKDLPAADSAALLATLQSYVTSPENTVRWRWQEGDVAFWDNRSTQHYAVADYGDAKRHVQRVTIAGSLPVSVDGTPSKVVKGDSSAYTPRAAA